VSNVTPMPAKTTPTTWRSPAQVCELVPGLTVRKLQRFRDEGRGPRYSKLGQTIVYAEADVNSWVREHLIGTREQS
jgi:hypothetical protein